MSSLKKSFDKNQSIPQKSTPLEIPDFEDEDSELDEIDKEVMEMGFLEDDEFNE